MGCRQARHGVSPTSSSSPTSTSTTTTTATFPRLNDGIDHNTNNIIDFLNDDYITHGNIDHDYSAHTLGYIDIGIKGYHLGSLSSSRLRIMLQSDRP